MDEIFYIIAIVFLIMACGWYKIIARLEEERSLELQEENEILVVKLNHMKHQLRKKKELLEIQDKLIIDKHTVYATIHKCSGTNYGLFYDKEKAERFIYGNVNLFVKEMEISK